MQQTAGLNLASDTAKRQLRAYVGAQHMAPYVLEPGKHPIAKIVIKNFGLTPASDIQAVGIIAMGGSSYPWFLKNRPRLGHQRIPQDGTSSQETTTLAILKTLLDCL